MIMKNMKTLIFCSLVLFAACKKDSSSVNVEATLTTGKWQLSDATVGIPGSSLTIDVYDSIPACVRDNFYTFAADGTLTVDEGATKCNSGDPQTATANWKLLNNNTQLQGVDVTGVSNTTATIVLINSSTLQLQDTTTYSGYSVSATATFTHH